MKSADVVIVGGGMGGSALGAGLANAQRPGRTLQSEQAIGEIFAP